jgi:hypothetical protein
MPELAAILPMLPPVLSVIIPAYNRLEPLKYTLRSAAVAAAALDQPVEIVLVDDGSAPSIAEQLGGFDAGAPLVFVRQSNQGSIVARLAGLRVATGTCVLFLDSDDLVHPDKFRRHAAAHREGAIDVSYDDMAQATLAPGYAASYVPGERIERTTEIADLLLRVQPAPHSPVYRRDYLHRALAAPLVPSDRRMDPAGDVWLYYNLAIHPARIVKIDAPLTAAGPHEEVRYSQHWEKLAIAALRVAEAFQAHCPVNPATLTARRVVGECAFNSWRRLPRDFSADFCRRTLAIWRRAPRGPLDRLGGKLFRRLAQLAGPVTAGRLLRQRNGRYAACRTLSDAELRPLWPAP